MTIQLFLYWFLGLVTGVSITVSLTMLKLARVCQNSAVTVTHLTNALIEATTKYLDKR